MTNGDIIKGSGPKVYLVEGGQRRWIQDPDSLMCIGGWGAVKNVLDNDLNAIPEGNPLPLRTNGTLLKGSGPKIYAMDSCDRHWIPDPETFNAHGFNWTAVQTISDNDLNAIPEGPQYPSVINNILADSETDLMMGRHMHTYATFYKTSGLLDAETHTWTNAELVGFTGGVFIWIIDANDSVIASTDMQQFGVDGKWIPFKQSSRTDRWSAQIDLTVANKANRLQIIHAYTPKNRLQPILDEIVETARKVAEAVRVLCNEFPEICSQIKS